MENFKDIIKTQLNLFLKKDKEYAIKQAYYYASPNNKTITGPYPRFKKMIKDQYVELLNLDSWTFLNFKKINNSFKQNVLILSNKKKYIYEFSGSKQWDFNKNKALYDKFHKIYLNNVWRIDSVTAIKTGGKKNQKNIFNRDLKVCSIRPMTGYYRDGYCNTGPNDIGTHTVCGKIIKYDC